MQQQLLKAIKYWDYIAPIATYPKNHKEFTQLVSQLDELLVIVGDDENHHLIGLVNLVSSLISSYEERYFSPPAIKGVEALKFLMQSHHLLQKDLSDICSQGVLSEILNGKRSLNLQQIKLLAKRFGVDPSTFIDND